AFSSSSACSAGTATTRPHEGHEPSGRSVFGFRNRLQVSHQGMGEDDLVGGPSPDATGVPHPEAHRPGPLTRGRAAPPPVPASLTTTTPRQRRRTWAGRAGATPTPASDGRDAVTAVGEVAVLALGQREAAHQLVPQVAE